jgi:hypothetical protein
VGERLITVEFRDDASAELSEFPAIDMLTAHQMLVAPGAVDGRKRSSS